MAGRRPAPLLGGRAGATGQWGGDHGGGRHIAPRPYTKSSLNQDFRTVRDLTFGKAEKRQLQDMRRSGAVEGDARSRINPTRWPTPSTAISSFARPTIRSTWRGSGASTRHARARDREPEPDF
jgi:hypothetical protein